MANEKKFLEWLQNDLTHFVAIVEEGSAAAGDPWQQGFSDHDLTVIVRQDITSEMKAVYTFLSHHPLGNTCLVGLRTAESFSKGSSINDLSLKFRAKTITGDDVVATKAVPSKSKAYKLGVEGLSQLPQRFERRWINLANWTDDYARHKNYEIFKNFFVYYAAYMYGKTGQYPTKREDAAATIENQSLATPLLTVTNNISTASKTEQKSAIEAALELIPLLLG